MKKISLSMKILLSVIILISFNEVSFCADSQVLEKLILTAREENPLISAAEERVRQAEGAVREAGAKMGPKLGVGAAAIWPRDRFVPIEGLPLSFGNVYVAAAGFVQTVYAGGSLFAAREAAQLAKNAAEAEKARITQTVTNSVRTAYYNWKRSCGKEKVASEAMTLARDHLARAEKLFKSGLIAKGDVLRNKVAVADAELNYIRACNAVEISVSALERAVGSAVDRKEIEEEKFYSDTVRSIDLTSETEGNIKRAYENRMEIKIYDLMSRRALKIARAAEGQLLPQIIAAGGVIDSGNEFFPSDNEEVVFSLIARWTIFDSGEVSAKTRQAKAQARELIFLIDDMKNTIRMEVTQAELNLKSAHSRLRVAERQVTESEEDYRIAVRRYEEQVGTNLDMLDARLALTNSRTEKVEALYDICIAEADLLYSLGY